LNAYWRAALAGVAAYLLFLGMNVPADWAARLVMHGTADLDLQAVSGTLLSGRAQRAVIHGLGVGPLAWSLRPLALLMGRLEYRLDLQDPLFRGTGVIGRGFGGRIYLRDLHAAVQPDPLINHFSPLPVKTSGDVTLRLESLKLVDGFPGGIAGRVDWSGARIVEPATLVLGHVEVALQSEADGLVCRISGRGETTVSGEISLTRQGDYRLNLLLTPGSAVSADIIDTLKTFGQARPGGAYLITDSGHL
jgi:general secretion pathway protein N